MELVKRLLEILQSILVFFFNRTQNKKLEVINKIEEKKQEVEFQSKVEEIVKKASSDDELEKQKAIEEMRKLVSE